MNLAQPFKAGSNVYTISVVASATVETLETSHGYGAFTVSKSNIPEVVSYIQNQREHHRKKTFQEEYLEFLRANGIDYDERYLWG